jgi:tagaturonate reductase
MLSLKPLNRQHTNTPLTAPVKVLQFGEGNFLRAFTDWVIDILNEKTGFNGAIQIVQPLPQGMGKMINEQEGLYHVVLNGIQNGKSFREIRLIRSVKGVINPFEHPDEYYKQAENPDLKFVVSNTTEAGIVFTENDHDFKTLPESFPGKVTALLYHRFLHFNGASDKGLILMPCELIEKNGHALKQCILQYIQHWSLPLAFRAWVEDHNVFCNTLVDRIVPGYPKDSIEAIQKEIGYLDKVVVMAEPFHLWVIEAPAAVAEAFPAGKTDLQVRFVDDLTPYRTRKVRILNGAHTAMVPVAYLKGLRTVQEAVESPDTGVYVRNLIFNEIIPTLDLPKEELEKFAADVLERFQNPFIRHELISIALNSISKYKVRVLPSLLEYYHRKKTLPTLLIQALAKLILFYKGEYQGERIALNDSPEILTFFSKAWQSNSLEHVVSQTLGNIDFWGQDLGKIPGLKEQLINIMEHDAKAIITR